MIDGNEVMDRCLFLKNPENVVLNLRIYEESPQQLLVMLPYLIMIVKIPQK